MITVENQYLKSQTLGFSIILSLAEKKYKNIKLWLNGISIYLLNGNS